MIRRPTRHKNYSLDTCQALLYFSEPAKSGRPLGHKQPAAHGILECSWLFVDFFEHKVWVALTLSLRLRPFHLYHLLLAYLASTVYGVATLCEDSIFTIIEIHHAPRMGK